MIASKWARVDGDATAEDTQEGARIYLDAQCAELTRAASAGEA